MTLRELDERQAGLNRSQTLNSVVVLVVGALMLTGGLVMRSSAYSATFLLEDDLSGIRARVPARWLVSSGGSEFVLEAEAPGAIPFKTVLRISIVPVGEEATSRNVVDVLILERAAQLSTYRVLSIELTQFDEEEAVEMTYAFVESDTNPFLNSVPVVVQGRDLVTIRGQQAIVITYLEERSRFAENLYLFDNFLAQLEL